MCFWPSLVYWESKVCLGYGLVALGVYCVLKVCLGCAEAMLCLGLGCLGC
jgi:hypothetical protein